MTGRDPCSDELDRAAVDPARPASAPADEAASVSEPDVEESKEADVPDAAGSIAPFGPAFFKTQLAAFVRDRCPDPAEALPAVEIHLEGGESLEVCHVIRLTPAWVALAVNDREALESVTMRTEIVPYSQIRRATIRGLQPNSARVGFSFSAPPRVAPIVGPVGARPLG